MMIPLVRATRRQAFVFGILGLCALSAAAREPRTETAETAAVETPETTIQDWPALSRAAARAVIAAYGEPLSFDDRSLRWGETGPWKRIVVSRDAPHGVFSRGGGDVVAQTIWYFAPEDRLADLRRFDDRLTYDMGTGELTSRAESEELNFLALNLADEVVAGIKTPEQARAFYRRAVRLSESGKSSPYMTGLHIPLRVPPRAAPLDPDAAELGL